MIRTTARYATEPCWMDHGRPHGIPHTVYIVRDDKGQPLYVGRTRNLSQRAKAHRSRARATWWPRMATVELVFTCCLESASSLELRLIRELRPTYNADPLAAALKAVTTRRRYGHVRKRVSA